MKKKYKFIIVVIIFTLLLIPQVGGEKNYIKISSVTGEEQEITNYYIIDQYSSFDISIVFKNNCESYSCNVYGNHPFSYFENGTYIDNIKKNDIVEIQYKMANNITSGTFNFTIVINYISNNITCTEYHDIILRVLKIYDIKSIILPSKNNYEFSLGVEIYYPVTEMTLELNTEGNIEFEEKYISFFNISDGIYFFNSSLFLINYNNSYNQEIFYHLKVYYNGRYLENISNNVPIFIIKTEQKNDTKNNNHNIIILLIVLIIIINIIVIIISIFLRFMKDSILKIPPYWSWR